MQTVSQTANPFATCCTRPGAIPFRFSAGANAQSLLARLRDNNFRGQIVGPHGAGKSTLLATLLPALEVSGINVRAIALHDGERRLPAQFLRAAPRELPLLVVVDGYEQLSSLSQVKLRWRCWRLGWGLLVTTHAQTAGLPTLITLAPSAALLVELLGALVVNDDSLELRRDAEISFRRHGGNLREVWFDLYDRHERNRLGIARDPAHLSSAAIAK